MRSLHDCRLPDLTGKVESPSEGTVSCEGAGTRWNEDLMVTMFDRMATVSLHASDCCQALKTGFFRCSLELRRVPQLRVSASTAGANIGEWARCIVDMRNAMADMPVSRGK